MTDQLQQLYEDFADAEVKPLWLQSGLLPNSPRSIRPYIWRWDTVRDLAARAGTLVPVGGGGDRRVLALAHPDLGGRPFASPTLWAGIQFLNGREAAPPHRHTPGALRFVIEGSGVWTMVNGDPVLMEPGDLVLTPSLNWHAHDNPGDAPMIWFDGLDLPMVQSLDAVFFEDGGDDLEPYDSLRISHSENHYAGIGLNPVVEPTAGPHGASPPVAYRWAATDEALRRRLNETGEESALLRYSNPVNGRDVMPSLRAEILRLRAGASTRPRRKVGSSVVLVYRGEGSSEIGEHKFSWKRGDVFVAPSWQAVAHQADSECDLFVLSDSPVIEAIGLGRDELA